MREIKFRAWDKEEKEFVENILITPEGKIKTVGWLSGKYLYDVSDRIEILLYTGLKDKNKEEVYDTDIIKIDNSILEVVKVDGGFIVRGINIEYENNIIDEWKRYRDKIIKLGNKYENPELLEAKDE